MLSMAKKNAKVKSSEVSLLLLLHSIKLDNIFSCTLLTSSVKQGKKILNYADSPGRRRASWLFTSSAGKLNGSGMPSQLPASGQSRT